MNAMAPSRAAPVHLGIAILGLTVVLIPLVGWLMAHGLDFPLARDELLSTGMTTAAFLDLLGAGVAVLAMIFFDQKELRVPHTWIAVVVACTVSVAFGLAFYLFLRERARALLNPGLPTTP